MFAIFCYVQTGRGRVVEGLRLSREFCEEMLVGGWGRWASVSVYRIDRSRMYYRKQEVRGEGRGRNRVVAMVSRRDERARSKVNGTTWF